jgi:hypothetical protein
VTGNLLIRKSVRKSLHSPVQGLSHPENCRGAIESGESPIAGNPPRAALSGQPRVVVQFKLHDHPAENLLDTKMKDG